LIETFAYLETQPDLDEVHIALHPQGDGSLQQRFYLPPAPMGAAIS
jgi:hypothetical protein